jgi:hypothetical protein
MARYKEYCYEQTKLIPIAFSNQILPGTFEYTLNHLIDSEFDLSVFEQRYHNDETGAPAYDPSILLKIILYAYARGITSSREIERCCEDSLANRATLQLFQLVVESFSGLQLQIPRRELLRIVRDQLSAGQARLLGHVVQQCQGASEVTQREIESTMGYSHSSPELFYRLESLIAQGFLLKRRISADGQFSYRLSDDFEKELREG